MVLDLRARQDWSGLWAECAWRWGAGSFMKVKELIEEGSQVKDTLENKKINCKLATSAGYSSGRNR